ncbi:uncharacterized protein [Panulirus ornatus]
MMTACAVGEPHAQIITSLFPPLAPIASFAAHHTPTPPIHLQEHHHPPHHPHGPVAIPLQEPPPAHIPVQVPPPTPRPPVQVQISTHGAPPHVPPHNVQIKDLPPTSAAPSSGAGVVKSPGGGVHETSDMRTLYVGNLDSGASEELLMAVFSHIGPVRSCKLIHE